MADLTYTLVILDNGTAVIKKVTAGLQGVGQAGTQAGTKTAQGARQAVAELSQLDRTLQRLQRTAAAFLGMWVLTKAIALPKELIATAIEFNSKIETAKLGIASLLMAQGEFTNTVMATVQGYDKLVMAQKMSGEIVKKLELDNLRTIATLDQLVEVFQSSLAPALEKGFNVDQVRQFTVAMVQAAGAMGLQIERVATEVRYLLSGMAINVRMTPIAAALGITADEVKRNMGNATGLFNFLMSRLESFRIAGMESQKTWLGLTSNLKDMASVVLGAGLENIFKLAKREAQALMDAVITINKQTGELEINPEVLESVKRLGYLFEAAYYTVKDIALIIGALRGPVDLLAEAWRSISISAQAVKEAAGGGGPGKTPGTVTPSWLPFKAPTIAPGAGDVVSKWIEKNISGKGITTILTNAFKEFNDYISGEGKYAIKEYMDYYQRQMEVGTTYTVRQRALKEDEVAYLLKVASETGYINERLAEQFKADMAIKGINVDLYAYTGKQLQAVVKTVEEYDKLKDTGKETLEAFKKLLDARLRIAAIETVEAPLKIVQQLAQSTDQYGEQAKIVAKLNEFAKEKLRLTNQLTPELKKQMDAQAAFSIAEIDRTERLGTLERQRDVAGLQQKYAQITGNIDDQLQAMKELTDIEVGNLMIQIEKTENLDKILELQKKISATQKLGAKEQEQFRITAPIQQRQPFYAAGLGLAEATGSAQAYERISKLILEDEIKSLKVSQEGSPYLQSIIELKTKQWEIDTAIRKVEMETYGGDIVAKAKENYASMTGDMTAQSEASKLLLDNEIKRTLANRKLSEDQQNVLAYYLKQIEASENVNRNLAKQKEILGWQQQLAALQGSYMKSKELEIALLEKDREALLEANKANWDAVKAINEYYDRLKEIAEARKDLNVFALMKEGGQKAVLQAHEDLANMYENILPNAVGMFTDSLRNSDWTSKTFFDNMKQGFANLIKDIAFAIVKMEVLTALMGQGKAGAAGTGGLVGLLGTTLGGVFGGLFGGGGTTSLETQSSGVASGRFSLAAAQHGGVFYKPTVTMIAEKNRPEAVIPLDKLGGGGLSLSMPITVHGGMDKKTADRLRDDTERFVINRLEYYSR